MSVTKVGAALLESGSKGADIASTGTMVIGKDGSYFDITGTTGITAMTVDAGRIFTLQFDGAVILTHSSTLYLAGAANFTTEANDHLTFVAVAANDVRQIGAGLKDGGSPIAAAGGSWTIINTTVASNDASITITGLSSTYDTYAIAISDVRPASDGQNLFMRLGDSSGIDSGGSDYEYKTGSQVSANTSYASDASTGASSIRVCGGIGNATGEGGGGLLYLHQPGDAATQPIITGIFAHLKNSTNLAGGVILANRQAVITVDRVNFFFDSGNVAVGRFTVYGVAHA